MITFLYLTKPNWFVFDEFNLVQIIHMYVYVKVIIHRNGIICNSCKRGHIKSDYSICYKNYPF